MWVVEVYTHQHNQTTEIGETAISPYVASCILHILLSHERVIFWEGEEKQFMNKMCRCRLVGGKMLLHVYHRGT